MDVTVEDLHNLLEEAKLPTSLDALAKPTEQYVIALIKKFLSRFSIDVNLICKPTFEQLNVMAQYDDTDIVALVNLQAVMGQIGSRIFIKILSITDITSPGQKKLRKDAQFLANFIIYVSTVESNIQDSIDAMHSRVKQLEDLIHKKNAIRNEINDIALHKGKQMSQKEKCQKRNIELQAEIKENNKRLFELKNSVSALKEKKQKILDKNQTDKTQIAALTKSITDLQSEIVTSPDEYKARLETLEETYKKKLEERETKKDSIGERNHLIKQQENTLNFIKKQFESLEISDLYKQLKAAATAEDNKKKQTAALKSTEAAWHNEIIAKQNEYKATDRDDLRVHCEERVYELRNLLATLFSEKKLIGVKLEERKAQYNEVYLKKIEMENVIKKTEEETSLLLTQCQNLYDTEINTEDKLWKKYREM